MHPVSCRGRYINHFGSVWVLMLGIRTHKLLRANMQHCKDILYNCFSFVILKLAVFFEQFLQFFVSLGESYICPLKESTSVFVSASKKGSSWV